MGGGDGADGVRNKTTTLAAAIDYLNDTVHALHIITLPEDPDRVLSSAQEMHGEPA